MLEDPQIQATFITGIFLLAAGILGGGYFIRHGRNNKNSDVTKFLESHERVATLLASELKESSKAIQSTAFVLNSLHEDMQEVIKESRDSHTKQNESLIKLLERD